MTISTFSHADFIYDGDGQRVKSVITSDTGVKETTYFMGNYYEVTGGVVTKYYFAGSTRIAMRKYSIPQPMTVEYFLSDHLGSTSLTTDAAGTKVSEIKYKPWGEVRSAWTATQTTTPAYELARYTFTGQYSYMDDPTTSGTTEGFGLMFYNARWYDPSLGRFAQADTIVPSGVQGYDRYAYANNSPLKFIDPSGHDPWWSDPNFYWAEEHKPPFNPVVIPHNQHDAKDDEFPGGGWNACGPTASCAAGEAMGIMSYGACMDKMSKLTSDPNNKYGYDKHGIQPDGFVQLIKDVFGSKVNVLAYQALTSEGGITVAKSNLAVGNQVIVDYYSADQTTANPNNGNEQPFAHFARIVDFSNDGKSIVLAQSMTTGATLTALISDFSAAWNNPEVRAGSTNAQALTYWMVILSLAK